MGGSGVVAWRPVSMAHPVSEHTPEMISGSRGPWRPTIRPDSGEATTVMKDIGTVGRPDWTGDRPRTSWRYRVFRSIKPPNAANAAIEMTIDDANGTDRKNRRSMSGCGRRGS